MCGNVGAAMHSPFDIWDSLRCHPDVGVMAPPTVNPGDEDDDDDDEEGGGSGGNIDPEEDEGYDDEEDDEEDEDPLWAVARAAAHHGGRRSGGHEHAFASGRGGVILRGHSSAGRLLPVPA